MGTWGPENLSSDSALDILHDRSDALVKEIIQLVESREAAEYDEYAYSLLFVLFETLFALARHRLIGALPEAAEAIIIKERYLERWDAYIRDDGQDWPERRAVIQRTFERFERLCRRDERRSESAPVFVEIVPRTIQEIAPDLAFSPHLVFGALHLSLPVTWSTTSSGKAGAIPPQTLASILARGQSGALKIGEDEFEVARVFFATGPSLVPEQVDARFQPYLLLMKLRRPPSGTKVIANRVAMRVEEDLTPFFSADGEYLSGALALEVHEEFDFCGLECCRPLDSSLTSMSLKWQRDLYFHALAENELLLMEYGGAKNNFGADFPDWILVGHLLNSLRPASE